MLCLPLPYCPPTSLGKMPPPVSSALSPAHAPFITLREGEEPELESSLHFEPGTAGRHRLRYRDEGPQDRDARGVLYGRVGTNPMGPDGTPTGQPVWKFMHPYRQMTVMQHLQCQVCTKPARTKAGLVFLATPKNRDRLHENILTDQPPVCARHVRTAAALCPPMDKQPAVILAQSAPLFGVSGVLYGRSPRGRLYVAARPDFAVPYGHPDLAAFLASQMIRRISSFRLLTLDELLETLEEAA